MVLEPHPVWAVYVMAKTFEMFQSNIPQMNINECVPEEIRNRTNIVKNLLIHSYFEYDFIDVALEKAFHTFEFALHVKYQMLNPGKKLKNLKPYLDWAVNNKLMDGEHRNIISYLRNTIMHDKTDRKGGTNLFAFFLFIEVRINELFVDKSN